jgi:hypothetical protein
MRVVVYWSQLIKTQGVCGRRNVDQLTKEVRQGKIPGGGGSFFEEPGRMDGKLDDVRFVSKTRQAGSGLRADNGQEEEVE